MIKDIKMITGGMCETNSYIISDENGVCVIVDPEGRADVYTRYIESNALKPEAILLTHAHFDHIGAVAALAGDNTPIWIHRLDAEMLTNPARNLCRMIRTEITAPPATRLLEEGDRLEAAGITLTVLHTPGHTPGSVCFRTGNHLFTGDTLFHGGYGRTDFPGGSPEDMRRSLARLAPLEAACAIYPGH